MTIPPLYQLVTKMFDAFEKFFTEDGAITFDYALPKAAEAIKKGKNMKTIDLSDIDLIIVDEFQDSNMAQINMIQNIMERSKKDTKLLMIGDFDQNIFTWRGSKFKGIQKFMDNYDDWLSLSLNKTYRLG